MSYAFCGLSRSRWGPWLVGSRRFSLSRKMLRRQRRRRNLRVPTRRVPQKLHWSTPARSAGLVQHCSKMLFMHDYWWFFFFWKEICDTAVRHSQWSGIRVASKILKKYKALFNLYILHKWLNFKFQRNRRDLCSRMLLQDVATLATGNLEVRKTKLLCLHLHC